MKTAAGKKQRRPQSQGLGAVFYELGYEAFFVVGILAIYDRKNRNYLICTGIYNIGPKKSFCHPGDNNQNNNRYAA